MKLTELFQPKEPIDYCKFPSCNEYLDHLRQTTSYDELQLAIAKRRYQKNVTTYTATEVEFIPSNETDQQRQERIFARALMVAVNQARKGNPSNLNKLRSPRKIRESWLDFNGFIPTEEMRKRADSAIINLNQNGANAELLSYSISK